MDGAASPCQHVVTLCPDRVCRDAIRNALQPAPQMSRQFCCLLVKNSALPSCAFVWAATLRRVVASGIQHMARLVSFVRLGACCACRVQEGGVCRSLLLCVLASFASS